MSIKQQLSTAVTTAKDNPRKTRFAGYLVVAIVFVVLIPFGLPSQLSILSQMLIWGMFAMGYDFMYGYSGVVSFGHAALFGLGAYGFALPIMHFGPQSVWLLFVVSILVSTIYAFVVGVISIRTREVYFAILTLAFAQVVYTLTVNLTDLTGGSNGVVFQLPALTVIPGVFAVDLYDPVSFYYLTLIIVVATYFLLRRLTNSPMGAVLRGVRENIDRLEYIGIDERWYRIAAFTISGAVSGLAGGLYAANNSFIGPERLEAIQSGEVIVWTIVGGVGTLIGPLFGGAIIYYVQDTVSNVITWWLIPIGLLFIAIVVFMPEGIAGRVGKLIDRFYDSNADS